MDSFPIKVIVQTVFPALRSKVTVKLFCTHFVLM